MKRDIINIDDDKCTGCGLCVPNCHEGAIQIIDGKARLVSELMCDGLGACIGHCPEGAITIETREAEPYNEFKVIEQMTGKGKNTVVAHLKHLKDHDEEGFFNEACSYLNEHQGVHGFSLAEVMDEVNKGGKAVANAASAHGHTHNELVGGCPGSRSTVLEKPQENRDFISTADQPSELRQWPVQMHLLNPNAPYLRGSDLLLAADCVAFSMGNFHSSYLKGKSLAIACPKLDHGLEIYIEKLTAMIDLARLNTITVMMMEVPCCGGLMQMVRAAQSKSSRKVPVKQIVVSLTGDLLS
ncbi:MAG: 4Fe-4S binding protein, partial [Bacteroidales bacterium]|nr:4Fe-4S binding protein [Bacteroidales bacterium]